MCALVLWEISIMFQEAFFQQGRCDMEHIVDCELHLLLLKDKSKLFYFYVDIGIRFIMFEFLPFLPLYSK